MKTRYFSGMGLFGNDHFSSQDRETFFEEWDKMPDSEKIEIINRRISNLKGEKCERHEMLSVEHIDKHCEDWMSKTPEEKEEFVEKMKEKINERHEMGHNHFGCHGHEFGGRHRHSFGR